MLQVGINENVVLAGATVNEQGTLDIKLKEFKEGAKGGLLESLNDSSGDSGSANGRSFLQFCTFVGEKFGGGQRTAEEVVKEIGLFRDMLTQILLGYLPQDQIKWDAGKGLTINESTITNEDTQKGIYANYSNQFVAMVDKLKDRETKKFRVKLQRSSAKKHFPKFPKYGQFWESMEIPANASKLKFSPKETELGYDNGTPAPVEEISAEQKAEQSSQLEQIFPTA